VDFEISYCEYFDSNINANFIINATPEYQHQILHNLHLIFHFCNKNFHNFPLAQLAVICFTKIIEEN
jgi:hypothetical protein